VCPLRSLLALSLLLPLFDTEKAVFSLSFSPKERERERGLPARYIFASRTLLNKKKRKKKKKSASPQRHSTVKRNDSERKGYLARDTERRERRKYVLKWSFSTTTNS
jgi:hypothetical protein